MSYLTLYLNPEPISPKDIDILFFCSPESKAQVSFSDQNLSVVRRRCRRWRRCGCRKLSHFHLPLKNQPNLAQSTLG